MNVIPSGKLFESLGALTATFLPLQALIWRLAQSEQFCLTI